MDKPRFSASGVSRMELCPASHTKEMEVFYFAESNGIVGVESGNDAHKGTTLHEILKEIPFFSKRYQLGEPFEIGSRIRDVATKADVKLHRGDFWFCYNAVRRRNLLIEDHLNRVTEESGGIAHVEFNLDARRLKKELIVDDLDGGVIEVPFSGLPDVMITVVDRYEKKHVLVVDYKTGFAVQQEGKVNRQLASLAALSSWEDASVESVGVSLIARNDESPDEISLILFGSTELEQARAFVVRTVSEAARLRSTYEDQRDITREDTPTAEMEKQLQDKSRFGEHCVHCKAKVCCQTMRVAMDDFKKGIITISEPVVAPLRLKVKQLKGKTGAEALAIMKPADIYLTLEVALSVTEPAELFAAVRKEAEELARQLTLSGTSIDGLGLKEGARHMKLKEKAVVEKDGGEKIITLPTNPIAVYNKLKPVLGTMELHDFIDQACEVDAGSVKQLLADRHKVDEKMVFEKVLLNLGPQNPFEMRPNKPTVILVPKTKSKDLEPAPEAIGLTRDTTRPRGARR